LIGVAFQQQSTVDHSVSTQPRLQESIDCGSVFTISCRAKTPHFKEGSGEVEYATTMSLPIHDAT